MNEQKTVEFGGGWKVTSLLDDDNHLNVYITNEFCDEIVEMETGQGNGKWGEQLALRFSTRAIEDEYEANR